jgi:hypothetical protein
MQCATHPHTPLPPPQTKKGGWLQGSKMASTANQMSHLIGSFRGPRVKELFRRTQTSGPGRQGGKVRTPSSIIRISNPPQLARCHASRTGGTELQPQ